MRTWRYFGRFWNYCHTYCVCCHFLPFPTTLRHTSPSNCPVYIISHTYSTTEKDSEWIQTELSLIGIIVQVHILPLSALHKLDLTQIADFLLGEQLSDEDQTYTYLSAFFGTHSFIQYHLTKAWNENIMKQLLTPRVEDRLAVLRLAEMIRGGCKSYTVLILSTTSKKRLDARLSSIHSFPFFTFQIFMK